MIRDCNELTTQCQSTQTSKHPALNPNKRNSTATDEYDFQMELDEQFGVNNPMPSLDDIDDDDLDDKQAKLQQLTANTIAYGQELGAEFANDPRREVKQALKDTFALIAYENAKESSLAPLLEIDGRMPVAEELNSAILGMSSYLQVLTIVPGKSLLTHITVSLGKSSSAAIERLVQQTEALVGELAEDGGSGAFVNVRKDFLQ